MFNSGKEKEKWSEESNYYNDHPGAQPPTPDDGGNVYSSPMSNQPVPDRTSEQTIAVEPYRMDLNIEQSFNDMEGEAY